MFVAKLHCDLCNKKIEFLEDYFFKSNLQDSLGMTLVKKYYKEYGSIYCKNCLVSELLKET